MTTIHAQVGQPLDHVFVTKTKEHGDINNVLDHHHNYQYEMEMSIETADGRGVLLYGDRGMHEGLQSDGTVVFAVSIHDAEYLGVGTHTFTAWARDADNRLLFKESGTIEVDPATGEENLRKEVRPWDLLDTKEPRVEKSVRDERLNICKSCEHYLGGICTKCKCVMKWKTTLSRAECPISKWLPIEPIN